MAKKKHMWTEDEVDALHAAVLKHGAGNWAAMVRDSEFNQRFPDRSNVDLKDKWRVLTRGMALDAMPISHVPAHQLSFALVPVNPTSDDETTDDETTDTRDTTPQQATTLNLLAIKDVQPCDDPDVNVENIVKKFKTFMTELLRSNMSNVEREAAIAICIDELKKIRKGFKKEEEEKEKEKKEKEKEEKEKKEMEKEKEVEPSVVNLDLVLGSSSNKVEDLDDVSDVDAPHDALDDEPGNKTNWK